MRAERVAVRRQSRSMVRWKKEDEFDWGHAAFAALSSLGDTLELKVRP